MNITVFKKILTNNHRFSPDNPEYRRVYLINIIYLFYIAVAVTFAVLNAITNSYTQTAIISAAAAVCVVMMIYFHKTDRINVCAYIAIALMICTMLAMFTTSGPIHEMFAWIGVFPPMAFFLLGRKKALVLTVAVLACLLIFMLFNLKNWEPIFFNSRSIVNIFASVIMLIVLISYFETSRDEAVTAVCNKNRELEEANSALRGNKEQLRLILDSTAEAIFALIWLAGAPSAIRAVWSWSD
jgi:membrane-associated HD superfamily phosphohydrolase